MKNNFVKILVTVLIVVGIVVGGVLGIRAIVKKNKAKQQKEHVHSYEGTWVIETEPTETEKGSVKGTCECGDVVTKEIPVLTDESFWSIESSTVTCETAGSITYHSFYGNVVVQKEALGHKVSELVPAKAATCLASGNLDYYMCENCHQYYNSEMQPVEQSAIIIPKEAHDMTHFDLVRPTADTDGVFAHYHCSKCDLDYNDIVGNQLIKTSLIIPAGYGSTEGMQTMYNLSYPNIANTPDEGDSWEYMDPSDEIEISWYVDVSSWVQPTGEDAVSKYIKEKTGITVKFETPVSDDGTKLATMIAGGVMPDVISLPTNQTLQIYQLASQGYVYDINTLAEKWAPSLYYNLPKDVWDWWAFGDGFTYGVPNHYYSYNDIMEKQLQPNGGMMVREDLFNEWQSYCFATLASEDGLVHYTSISGVEKTVPWQGYITTPEGFKEAAKYILANHKGTKKGDISTGLLLSQFNNNGCTSLTWLAQFFAIPFEDINGNLIYQFTEDSYRDMLLYLNDLFNEGIISKANFTYDYNGVGGVVASGGAFATLVTPQDYQMHFVTASESNLGYISMYITNENGDAPVLADIRGYGYLMNMITTSCTHPDKVIKLFDFLSSKEGQLLVTLGIEGVTWNYTDETETEVVFTETYLNEKAAGTSTKYGLMQFDVLINYQLYDNMQPKTNNGKTPQELLRTNLKRPLTIYAYDYNAMHFVVDTTDSRYPTYAQSMAKIESLIGKQLPKIIQAKDRAEAISIYNKTVETMNSYGLDLVKEMNAAAYQKTKEKLGITVAWPPYQDGYNVKPDRLNPNGDLTYYRSY